tara:strand:+ start:67563 stop:68948 length:1386 start_codon:yes stop_codon:yes gene_type:complete
MFITGTKWLVMAIALASCGNGPAKRETLPLANSFSSQGGESAPNARWWKALGDKELDKKINQALSQSFSLSATRQRLLQAKADSREIEGSALPSVSAELDGGYRRTLGTVPGFNVIGTTWSAGIAASYEIDLWGSIRSAKKGVEANIRAARFDMDTAAITLSAEVGTAWYRWVEASEQGRLRKTQTETTEQILAIVEARFSRGQVSGQDVFRQRQVVDAAKQAEVATFASGLRWRNRLAALLSVTPQSLLLPESATLPTLPKLPEVGTPVSIIQRRPDLQAAYQRLIAADASAATALAERYPRLSLRASINSSTRSISTLFQNWLLAVGGNLLVPLFEGGRLKARADSASAAAQAAWFSYAQASLNAINEIEDSLATNTEAIAQVASLTKQVEYAERGLAIARAGYVSGQATYLQALDALLTLQALERDLLQSRRNAIEVRINLYRAVAGPLEQSARNDDN